MVTKKIWYFRKFHLMYGDRLQILHPISGEYEELVKLHLSGGESTTPSVNFFQLNSELTIANGQGFNPNLSWSHYRALLQVTKREVREFYEQEASPCLHETDMKQAIINNLQSFLLELGKWFSTWCFKIFTQYYLKI